MYSVLRDFPFIENVVYRRSLCRVTCRLMYPRDIHVYSNNEQAHVYVYFYFFKQVILKYHLTSCGNMLNTHPYKRTCAICTVTAMCKVVNNLSGSLKEKNQRTCIIEIKANFANLL